jgi:ATP synthase protein I
VVEQDPNKARLDRLARRLDDLNQTREVERQRRTGSGSAKGVGLGMRVVTELLAGVLGGLIVGWFLDRWLGTSPWLLITLLVLGVAAAFRNVWKLASRPPEDDGQA